MPLLDTSSSTLTAEQAEAYMRQSSRARIVAVQKVSELEAAETAKIPDKVWTELFEIWRRRNREKENYQEQVKV